MHGMLSRAAAKPGSQQASSPTSLTKEFVLRVGSVVQVLPGRQFPSFSSGDVGVVKRVDEEARTCDVLFDHGAGPLTVAMRHLKLLQDLAMHAMPHEGLIRMEALQGNTSPKAARNLPADLEVLVASQQRALSSLEARLSACEAALSVEDAQSKPASRLVAARVAALEGAHQAEVNELRRALNEAVGLSREQDNLHRKHRTSGREMEQLFQSLEQRCQSLQDTARRLESELSGLTASMSSSERRAANLQDVVTSSSTGLSEMAALLEAQERRTVDLAQALSSARKELVELTERLDRFETSRHSFPERRDRELKSPASTRAMDSQESDAIWKALRELQELVVHESEHRAAGLREVLGVVGKDAEQLRSEQTRHEAEIEGRCKAESLKIKHHIAESQARVVEHEKQTNRLDKRMDTLSQAFVWLEEQVRDANSASKGSPVVRSALNTSPSRTDSPSREEGPSHAALKRLQALEARFDKKTFLQAESHNGDQRVASSATEETLEKLRGQLDGLRAELKAPGDSGGQTEVAGAHISPRLMRPAEVRAVSPAKLLQAAQPPRVVYSYQTVASTPPMQAKRVATDGQEFSEGDDRQPRIIYSYGASLTRGSVTPTATVGIDLNKDGKADVLVSGTDLNNDGLKASLAVVLSPQGYVRPTDSIATFGQQVKRSNIAERQFLAADGADGRTVFQRERNRLQRSVVAAADYRAGKSESATDDRDLEEIERDVEEAIQIAVADGKFDNLEGKGKPLKSLLGAENPYLDPADRIGYGLLQKHGYAPEWIEQQKRIHRDAEHLARTLSEAWRASRFEPTAAFVTQKDRFRREIAHLNKRVRDYNLNCPASAQMVFFEPADEVRKAKRDAEMRHAKAQRCCKLTPRHE
ncbi:Dnajc28 [Symbiodinium pilosum]|uniref:Dnajc28 protein n=1 Tax=Symbiodinium pilosum TaxID=2952 RepID=A0A812QZU3_SYMPI|nr:Dnajc28 [Symbiodinium pilosum]